MIVQVPCRQCKKPVGVEIEEPKIINMLSCSVILIEHPKQSVCFCGLTVVPSLAQIGGMAFVAVPVPSDAVESHIIQPSGPLPKVSM
jgi:hypothetical protein